MAQAASGSGVRSVFITYRRSQTASEARLLFNDLVAVLGPKSVFMDVDTIALGRDFREIIRERLESCDLLLALVGKDWVAATDETGRRRLEDPDDFVRLELETALKRNIPVTPVLVQGARMPRADELPADLRPFAFRNNFELTHSRWHSDVDELLKRLGVAKPASPVPSNPAGSLPRRLALVGSIIVVMAVGALWWSQGSTNGGSPPPVSNAITRQEPSPTAPPPEATPPPQNTSTNPAGQTARAGRPNELNRATSRAALPAPPSAAVRFVNSGAAAGTDRAVLIVDERQQANVELTSRVAAGIGASDSLFKPDFVSRGVFMQAHRGDLDVLKQLSLDGMHLIALGTTRVTTRPDDATGVALVEATVDVQLRLVRPADGYASSLVSISGVGGGFDDRRAIDAATQKVVNSIVQRIGAR